MFKFIYETRDYQGYVNFEFWFIQKILNFGGNKQAYWPVHWTSKVHNTENILVGIDAYPGIMGGCYTTGRGGLLIGNYSQIASNVTIVTANQDLGNIPDLSILYFITVPYNKYNIYTLC